MEEDRTNLKGQTQKCCKKQLKPQSNNEQKRER